MPYYIIKDKESPEAFTPPVFIPADKVEKHICFSDNLYREIAMQTNTMQYYDRCDGMKNKSNLKNLLKHNWVYDADMDTADRYIKYFMEEFDPDPNYKLHKVYMDIETDLLDPSLGPNGYIGFPDEEIAPCPINIISLTDGKNKISYSFIYENKANQSLLDFKNMYFSQTAQFKKEIIDLVFERNKVLLNDIQALFYPSEKETIEAFFKKLHEIDPDYVLSWNQVFDAQTMMNRLIQRYDYERKMTKGDNLPHGYDRMLNTVCDSKYMFMKDHKGDDVYLTPRAKYTARKDQNIVDRMDTFTVLDGAIWIDQMLLYANIRKSSGMKENYSLDAIANEELGSEKLDYTGYTIKNLPWKNFKKFFIYNLLDTVLLDALETKNLDVDMIQKLCEVTNTRKYKVFKKTVSLKNYVGKFAEMQGYVMSDNKNARYGDDTDYFEANYLNKRALQENNQDYYETMQKKENFGAYVGNPELNEHCGIKVNGKISKYIYENVFDEDFSALYPSIIRAENLDSTSLIGKFFLIDNHIKQKLITEFGYDGMFVVSANEEATASSDASSNDIGPIFADSLISQNWSRIGEKYFDLPSASELVKELKSK